MTTTLKQLREFLTEAGMDILPYKHGSQEKTIAYFYTLIRKSLKIKLIMAISIMAFGCSQTPKNYNKEICTRILESQFEHNWVDSFSPANKMEPNTCTIMVVTRQSSYTPEKDILIKYELNAAYKTFDNGEFSYTHETNNLGTELAPKKNLNKAALLQIAEELDAKYGENDMCTGYLKALINNEPTGTGQQECKKPLQFRDY